MKAIIENNSTYEITGERGDFFICKNSNGKIKMFVKSSVKVEEIESMPKAKKYKSSGVRPTDAQHARTMAQFHNALLQENFCESQINSGNYNLDTVR